MIYFATLQKKSLNRWMDGWMDGWIFNIVNSVKFSNYKNDFQQKLDIDIADHKQYKDILVFADKTSSIL